MAQSGYFKVVRGTVIHDNRHYIINEIIAAPHKDVASAVGSGSLVEIPESHVPEHLKITPSPNPEAIAQELLKGVASEAQKLASERQHQAQVKTENPEVINTEIQPQENSDIANTANAAVRARGKQPPQ